MRKLLLGSLLASVLSSAALADTFTLSSVNGGAATGSPRLNFDSLDLGAGTQWADSVLQVSFTGTAQVVQGAASGLYAAPFVSGSNGVGFGSPDQPTGADTTRYLSTGIGSVIFNFTYGQRYFGLLWGSVDNYNSLSFYSHGSLVGSFTGTDVWASANGDQGQQGTYYVNFYNTNGTFDKVIASSTQYAFELDNVAYNSRSSVPDSGTTALLFGLGFVAMIAARRKA